MIENKKMFYTGIVLSIALIVISFPFPHDGPFGETIASALHLPTQSANGLQYIGMTSLALFIACLALLTLSVNKYSGRIFLLTFLILAYTPSMIVSSYQNTLAIGVYAVSYEREESHCQFQMLNDTTLHGICELSFENYSDNEVEFAMEFYEKYLFEEDIHSVSLMNKNAPYIVTLDGNERKKVKIESFIDVSNIEYYAEYGSYTGINIMIKSGNKVRNL